MTSNDQQRRADARRNYEALVDAARQAFADGGAETSLKEISTRAGVSMATLYRHFPNRQALLEAVYAEEVDALCRSAADFVDAEPWDAFVGWLQRLTDYLVTKKALAPELLNYLDRDAVMFKHSRTAVWAVGVPLLERAQQAGDAREDVIFDRVVLLVRAIANTPAEREDLDKLFEIVIDGLRRR